MGGHEEGMIVLRQPDSMAPDQQVDHLAVGQEVEAREVAPLHASPCCVSLATFVSPNSSQAPHTDLTSRSTISLLARK